MELRDQACFARYASTTHDLITARALGPLVIGEQRIVQLDREPGINAGSFACRDMMVLYLPIDGVANLHADGTSRQCRPGGALLLDPETRWTIDGGPGFRCYTVILPRVFLALAAANGVTPGVLPRTPGLEAIRIFVEGAMVLDEELSPPEESLAVGAMQYLFAAAFLRVALPDRTVALREAGLLQRITEHVDGHLAEPLSVSALCLALSCSRSALYRAANPVGGIAELIARRRLAAVYGCLVDAGDRRPIATIAIAHGFSDAAQFSRRFSRTFGTTARQVRAARATSLHAVMHDAVREPFRAVTYVFRRS